MNRKLLLVVNPRAGKNELRGRLMDIIDAFVRGGYEVTVKTTQRAGELTKIVMQDAGRFEVIVCCGGDGTLNEALCGAMACEKTPVIGYIPAGTVNDFAASLNIPRDPVRAAEAIINGSVALCDVGRFQDRYFSYIAAFGAFTDVSYQTPQENKNLLGRAAYLLEAIRRLPIITSYHIKAEWPDGVIEDDVIFGMAANSSIVAGIPLNAKMNISLCDGLLEVLFLKKPANLLEQQQVLNGLLWQEENNKMLYFFKTDRLRITATEPLAWTLDGEYGGEAQQAEIRNIPHAFPILTAKPLAQ